MLPQRERLLSTRRKDILQIVQKLVTEKHTDETIATAAVEYMYIQTILNLNWKNCYNLMAMTRYKLKSNI